MFPLSKLQRPLIFFTSYLFLLFLFYSGKLPAQVASFTGPDTVCVNEPVVLTNTSTGGGFLYYWNFCSGSANTNPTGVNIGNPGNLLDIPTYITLVKFGTNCWSFVSCQGVGVVRYFHGYSFKNNPLSWTNLGTFGGTISFSQEGIQVKEDNGQWYGFVCSDTKLVRLNFSNSPGNTPTATSLNFTGLNMLHGLQIIKEGNTWLGFATCSTGNKMVRFNFGNSLANTPVMTDFGNLASFNTAGALCLVQENGLWYGLVMAGNNSLARITFGSSLLNTPTGVNLGNPGGFNSAIGLTLLRDCEATTGYWVNYLSPGQLGKLTFPTGITGTVTGQILGNIGNLDKPHSFSELFRQNDTLFAYITNRQNGTLTRLTFPPCNNASTPSSTLFNPPPFSYSTPGTYNVRLIINEGNPDQSSMCKSIVVLAAPCNTTATFTAPDTVCVGEPVSITNQSSTGGTYQWNFCSGNSLSNPVGTNIGNPGSLLNIPVYMTLVKDGNTCYSFIANQGTTSVIRYNHGSSFNNNPLSWTNLGSFGYLSDSVMGVKVCQDNGQWIGFINNNNRVIRLNFGTSPGNVPTASQLGPYSLLDRANCIDILREGTTWIGFISCSQNHKLIRLNFGTSLLNTPTLTDLGSPGSLNKPGSFRIISENGAWFMLIVNYANSTLTRISFGYSLLNAPTGVNLGVVCSLNQPGGITLIRDCDEVAGFQLHYTNSSPNLIWRLNFPGGITGPATSTALGNIGSMSRPSQFSELFRVDDTLYLYNTNQLNGTLTRLRFLPCSNASVPSSALYNPPVFSYNQPGTYNIQLIVNEGQPTQASVCKSIVVLAAPCTATAAFTAPDTVCVGEPVSITNQSTTGANYYWNFCSGSAASTPVGTNMGTLGGSLNWPVYSSLVKEGSDCFTFITNQGVPTHITRVYHGNNFRNDPISTVSLLQTGILHIHVESIQIVNDSGTWYGLVCNNNTILRLNFGSSLWNVNPTITDLGPFQGLTVAHGLSIVKEGNTWLAFFNSSSVHKFYRLNFGTSLANTPVFTDFGNIAVFAHPVQIAAIKENGLCYLFMNNYDNNTLSRISFGNSYLNPPAGQNLGNCGGLDKPHGISLLNDCETSTGYYTTYRISPLGTIGRLNFSGGVGGTVTAQSLGNLGNLDNPCSFSELFRENDSLFSFVLNQHNSTMTRFSFPPCSNASVPSSTLYNPPTYSYSQPGTYNVRLIVNEGLFTQASICKSIIAIAAPIVSLGTDRSICPGTTTTLDAGAGFTSYLWSTGATTRMITVGNAGSYWAKVSNYGCYDYDTINVALYPVAPVNLGPDQTICDGQTTTFNAGSCSGCSYVWSNLTTGQANIGTGPNYSTGSPGIYAVMVTSPDNCILRDTVQLSTNPTPSLNPLPVSQPICSGSLVVISLSASIPLTSFTWTVLVSSPDVTGFYGGSGNVISQTLSNSSFVNQTVTYQITPFIGNCTGATVNHTIVIKPVPVVTVLPASQSVCHGTNVTINLSSNVSGTAISWTASASSPLVSGFSASSGTIISQTLFNTAPTIETVTYQISSIASGCTGEEINYPVSVYPVPDVYFNPPEITVCTGTPIGIQLLSHTDGAAFSWEANGSSSYITNYFNGNGSVIQQTPLNSGPDTEIVTYTITATANGCSGMAVPFAATIHPSPVVILSSTPEPICSGETFTVEFSSATPGTTYSWSASASSASVSGYFDGNGTTLSQTLESTAATVESVTYLILPQANGCIGNTSTLAITLKPTPDILFSPAFQTVCYGQSATILLSSSFPEAICFWTTTASSPSVSGYSNGGGNLINQDLYTTGTSAQTVTYFLSSNLQGCTSLISQAHVLTYPVPDLMITPSGQTICSGEHTSLTLQSQLSGTTFQWSATGSSAITGYSNDSGSVVTQWLTNSSNTSGSVIYAITPSVSNCPGYPSQAIVDVHPNPAVSLAICTDSITTLSARSFVLKGGLPGGGVYSGEGVENSSGMFNPLVAGIGFHQIFYTYINAYSCPGVGSSGIRVVSDPVFSCNDMFTDVRDGHQYATYKLPNGKCWMAENLVYGETLMSAFPQTDNCRSEKYCANDNGFWCLLRGGFYQWEELMEYDTTPGTKGICPPGWHIPAADEWNEMLDFNMGASQAAGPLKDLCLMNGFHAKPGGFNYLDYLWTFGGWPMSASFFWTSTPSGATSAFARGLNNNNPSISLYPGSRANAFSVRCVKD